MNEKKWNILLVGALVLLCSMTLTVDVQVHSPFAPHQTVRRPILSALWTVTKEVGKAAFWCMVMSPIKDDSSGTQYFAAAAQMPEEGPVLRAMGPDGHAVLDNSQGW